jgi:hypothetical protein
MRNNAPIQGGHLLVASGRPAHNKKESVQFAPLVVAIALPFTRQFKSAQKLGATLRPIPLPAPAFSPPDLMVLARDNLRCQSLDTRL